MQDDDDPDGDPANGFPTDLNMFQTPVVYQGSANANTLAQPTSSSTVKLPQGTRQGNFWIPDLKKLAAVTNSKRLKSYLFVSDDTVPSVEKGKLTDILKRRSGIDKGLRIATGKLSKKISNLLRRWKVDATIEKRLSGPGQSS